MSRLTSVVGTTPKSLASSFTVMCPSNEQDIGFLDSTAFAHMTPFEGNLANKLPYNTILKL